LAKQRIYELARIMGLESKEVLARAQELGLDVKTASSGLDEDAAALVRLSFEETDPASAEAPESAELEATACQLGMTSLWHSAHQAVESGATSPSEIRRVLGW